MWGRQEPLIAHQRYAQAKRFGIFAAGQKRRVTPTIKRQMRRRSAVEPVVSHIKPENRMGRNYFAGEDGDAV